MKYVNMADATQKAQKLSAARRKLKEYQQKSIKSIKNEENAVSSVTTSNSSRHSSISNGNSIDHTPEIASFEIETEQQQSSPFHNYFNGNQKNNVDRENQRPENTINFFDNLPIQNTSISESNMNFFKTTAENQFEPNVNDDVKSVDYPEVESRNVYGFYPKEEHPTVSSEDAKRLSEFLKGNSAVINLNDHSHQFHTEPLINQDTFYLNQSVDKEPNLKQEALEFAKVAEENVSEISKDVSESNTKSECEISPTNFNNLDSKGKPLNQHDVEELIKEYRSKVKYLEERLELCRTDYEHKLNTELGSLQERLQAHVKTIEMYIAENNKLSDSLLQSQTIVKQKEAGCEDLQGRLKASRLRVVDLEKELQVVKTEKTKLDQAHIFEAEMIQLKQRYEELKHLKEESAQDILELREKLNIKANENIGLQRELQDITHQFSLAKIKIEQISVGENSEIQSHIEVLGQQKSQLENQVRDLSQTLKVVGEEKVQLNMQYQNYVQQLNTQIAQLATNLETMSIENDNLSKREQGLVKHIGDLEKHLQSLQDEQVNNGNNKSGFADVKKELDTALELSETLQKAKDELQEKYQHICGDQDDLLTELATKKDIIEQLENEVERLKIDQPNSAKLLADIESDKVAASRAVAQNSMLKQELEEMQQAFVHISNNKMELTERLSSEQYKANELQERLTQLESKLHTLSDAIEIKDNELTHVRETLALQNKQLIQNNQLTDRLRHYEAQDSSNIALQEDLRRALVQINELMAENLKLKNEITPTNLTANLVVSDEVAVRDFTLPESEVTVEIKETQTHNDELDYSKLDNNFDKELAMKHLEDKFTRIMVDIANLTEEKHRLEHIVTQLQGETDTIGEYIALYQHQRGILQQRTQEKEEQLKRLTNDRYNVRNKLEMINDLVNKLVQEKGVLTPEILEKHDELCNHSHDSSSEHGSHLHKVGPKMGEGENNNVSNETAGQIIQLLSEIKSSNLVQPCDNVGNFHPCSCCSGQLVTV